MPLMSKAGKKGQDFEPIPEGTHIARCVTVVDFGLQEKIWKGKTKLNPQVWIAFEIPGFRVEFERDDKQVEGPGIIGSTYTNSIHENAVLGQHLTSWRGRSFTDEQREGGFDLFSILDVPCMISVTHNIVEGRTKPYANISSIMGLPKGTVAPDRETPLMKYSPFDGDTIGNLAKLPDWMKEKIEVGAIHAGKTAPNTVTGSAEEEPPMSGTDFDDDIPF